MRKRELAEEVERLNRESVSQEIQMSELNAYMQSLKDENDGWSKTGSASKRNRTWDDVRDNLEQCFVAWSTNPLAKSYCDYMRYFVIGKGTQIEVDGDDAANERIRTFCELNDWSLMEKQITEELSRDGEVFVRYHDINRNELEATVATVSLVDPLEVPAIDCPVVNRPVRYRRTYVELGEMADDGKQTHETKAEWLDADEITHIKINTSYNEIRGRSDLLVILPWLWQLKRWMADMSRRNYNIGSFNWDVTCKGGVKPSAVTARYPNGPMPGSTIAHGENEVWSAIAPDLHWADTTEGARAIKLMVMSGYKMPESWFGDTGESNLSTTKALAMPTVRAFVDRQDTLKFYFEQIIERGARVEDVTVTFPEVEVEEAKAKADALLSLGKAFQLLQDTGLLSRESAYKVLQQYMDTLDNWDEDESGAGEKQKIETEDQEETLNVTQGRDMGEPEVE